MVIVIATVICKSGHRTDFLNEFQKIVPEVLEEDGCIEYGPTVDTATDIGNQNVDENRVTIVEKWESKAALKAHLVAPHMEAYRPKVKVFVEASELRVLETA
ncbi:MAG: putative quinol monooxygenase [Fuerstiella sp.]|jgi:quinol monooxygenase YgiN|nr:putative quinol monooxygenase [Fuerstiella sp.]